jgi:hypothetical protein
MLNVHHLVAVVRESLWVKTSYNDDHAGNGDQVRQEFAQHPAQAING